MSAPEASIRAQAKKSKGNQGTNDAPQPADGREKLSKEVVKAVLVSPLIVPWLNIPGHLQKSVLASLPRFTPSEIADYHVSRTRCQQKEKTRRRKSKRATAMDRDKEGNAMDLNAEDGAVKSVKAVERPASPAILDHLVLGINENIKTLERSIDDLKLRLIMIADRLNGNLPSTATLIPTAPRSPSPPPSAEQTQAPLGWIIIPLLSISPQALVSPIPQYCASYNTLVYQWNQLSKVVKTRLTSDEWVILGESREEIRVVPLGRVESEMATMVGLRRLACLGVRTSHPEIKVLHDLLPKSILHPPRYSITLPFPSSALKTQTTKEIAGDDRPPKRKESPTSFLPLPHVHYAPLSIKGITTTVPADPGSRKKKRMEEVRARRIQVKEREKDARRKEILKGIKGLSDDKGRRRQVKKTKLVSK